MKQIESLNEPKIELNTQQWFDKFPAIQQKKSASTLVAMSGHDKPNLELI